MRRKNTQVSVIKPFNRGRNKQSKNVDTRDHVDGAALLGELTKELNALETIDQELENSIQDLEREIYDSEGNVLRTEHYRSTLLDRETIAVYHTRQSGRKTKIDTLLKMLNKVLPDLKAIENTDDTGGAAERALLAFKKAASGES